MSTGNADPRRSRRFARSLPKVTPLSELIASIVAAPPAAPAVAAAHLSSTSELLAQLTAGLAAGDDLRLLLERFLPPIVQLAGAQAGAVRIVDTQRQRM